MQHEKIVILDFGSQYTQLIARRVRELSVYCEILPHTISAEKILNDPYIKGIIYSGGPASVYKQNAPLVDNKIYALNIPILGICYGMQRLVLDLGGQVDLADHAEYGQSEIFLDQCSVSLFSEVPDRFMIWNSHSDSVISIPKDFQRLAYTQNTQYVGIANLKRNIYGLQFHPEVEHTLYGKKILSNFLFKICACHPTWISSSFIEYTSENIKHRIGNSRVILGLSGGIDSSVTAALLSRAIGNQLTCIFIDNGLLRFGEKEIVEQLLKRNLNISLHTVDESDKFLKKLIGITDPEEKRKIIGNQFIESFEEIATTLEQNGEKFEFLAQGTLYPDVIESLPIDKNPSSIIKSHHNVGGLPEKMKFKLIEPLRELFKDEVKKIGRELGLSSEIIDRHPFPGPGLAIRIVGEITHERLSILRSADKIVIQEMKLANWYSKVWQSFAVLLPIQSVGIQGDERTYQSTIVLRIVESIDGMTANWTHIPYEILNKISTRILNEVKGVNRCLLDISSKPPATIEWE